MYTDCFSSFEFYTEMKNTLNIRKNKAMILLLIDNLENRINFQSDKCDSSVIEDHAIREKFILTVPSE